MMPKFRVWDKENDRMLIPGEDSDCITLEIDENGINVYDMEHPSAEKGYDLAHLDCELMQSTGLIDKNGIEIYEGDILKILVMSVSDKYVYGEVVYEYGVSGLKNVLNGWGYEQGLIPLLEVGHVYEVVGNIYENPELLEGD